MLRNQEGASAVEFAVVASAFFMLMLGVIEYGMIMFTKVTIESTVQRASREVGLGKAVPGCPDRACAIVQMVQEKTRDLIHPESASVNATVVSGRASAAPPVPDVCLDNVNDPYPAACSTWEENGGGPGYQPAQAMNNLSIGRAGDIVEIRVTYLWRVLFPMFRSYFGDNGVLTITSSTVVKNEPF